MGKTNVGSEVAKATKAKAETKKQKRSVVVVKSAVLHLQFESPVGPDFLRQLQLLAQTILGGGGGGGCGWGCAVATRRPPRRRRLVFFDGGHQPLFLRGPQSGRRENGLL